METCFLSSFVSIDKKRLGKDFTLRLLLGDGNKIYNG